MSYQLNASQSVMALAAVVLLAACGSDHKKKSDDAPEQPDTRSQSSETDTSKDDGASKNKDSAQQTPIPAPAPNGGNTTKPSGNTPVPSTPKETNPLAAALHGTWESQCQVFDLTSLPGGTLSSFKISYKFAANDVNTSIIFYSDGTCTNVDSTMLAEGSYVLGKALTKPEGATAIDFISRKLVVTANKSGMSTTCGDQEIKVAKGSTYVCDVAETNYEIFKIEGNKLYLGDDEADDAGDTPEKRPTSFSTVEYRKI